MIDQLVIGSVGSYDTYEASVSERAVHEPTKKSIKETVPFSNVTYDFSAINGEIYWEERELEYLFEIIADTPEELEEKKRAFLSWIMNVNSEELHDPFIKDYHFLATFDSVDVDDSEIEKSSIEVTFTAYPYKIADEAKEHRYSIATGEEITETVVNNSSHRLTPTLTVEGGVAITLGNVTYAATDGTYTDETLKLAVGSNSLKLKNTGSAVCNVLISFHEEVF